MYSVRGGLVPGVRMQGVWMRWRGNWCVGE